MRIQSIAMSTGFCGSTKTASVAPGRTVAVCMSATTSFEDGAVGRSAVLAFDPTLDPEHGRHVQVRADLPCAQRSRAALVFAGSQPRPWAKVTIPVSLSMPWA